MIGSMSYTLDKSSSVAVAAMFGVCVVLCMCDFLYSRKKRGRVGRVPTSLSPSFNPPPCPPPLPPPPPLLREGRGGLGGKEKREGGAEALGGHLELT